MPNRIPFPDVRDFVESICEECGVECEVVSPLHVRLGPRGIGKRVVEEDTYDFRIRFTLGRPTLVIECDPDGRFPDWAPPNGDCLYCSGLGVVRGTPHPSMQPGCDFVGGWILCGNCLGCWLNTLPPGFGCVDAESVVCGRWYGSLDLEAEDDDRILQAYEDLLADMQSPSVLAQAWSSEAENQPHWHFEPEFDLELGWVLPPWYSYEQCWHPPRRSPDGTYIPPYFSPWYHRPGCACLEDWRPLLGRTYECPECLGTAYGIGGRAVPCRLCDSAMPHCDLNCQVPPPWSAEQGALAIEYVSQVPLGRHSRDTVLQRRLP